jgi:hypothetical protein
MAGQTGSPGASTDQVSSVFQAVDMVFKDLDMAWGNYWEAETFKTKMDMWNKDFAEKVRQFNTSTGLERQKIGLEINKMKNDMTQFKKQFAENKRQFGEKMALEWAGQKLDEWKAQQDAALGKEKLGLDKERVGIEKEQLGLEKQKATSGMRTEALARQQAQYEFGNKIAADKTNGAFGRALAYGIALGMKGSTPGQQRATVPTQAPIAAPTQAPIAQPIQAPSGGQ